MKTALKPLVTAMALSGAFMWNTTAQADVAEVISGDGEVINFEYEGDKLRFNTGEQGDGYMLMRDSKMYVVSMNDGEPMVFDLGSAMKMFGAMAQGAVPETAESKVLSLDATGREETVAGIEGEVYELKFVDSDGQQQMAELVLSEHPLAVGFRDAIQQMTLTMAELLDNDTLNDEIEAGLDMQSRLTKLDLGVLRYGQDMKLRSVSDTRVADSRFELPAEPTNFGQMMSDAFGGGSQGSSGAGNGGILGGLFGGGAAADNDASDHGASNNGASNNDASDNSTETRENGSTGEAVGKAVGEAFGRLFGN